MYLYFKSVHSDNARNVNIRIPIVQQYNLYTFMWEKFGYKPHEVDALDVRFVKAMAAVASADGRAMSDRMRERSQR